MTEEEICSICCDPVRHKMPAIKKPNIAIMPRCSHVFHSICILEALKHSKKCPNCRKAVLEEQLAYIPDRLLTLETLEIPNWQPSNVPTLDISMAMKRLHRDLKTREAQIEELELKLEEANYTREDAIIPAIQDLTRELDGLRLELRKREIRIINLERDVGFLEVDLKHKDAEISELNAAANASKNQFQALKAIHQDSERDRESLKMRLAAYQSLDSINLDFKGNNREWDEKITKMMDTELNLEDLKRFVKALTDKLRIATENYHTFKERAFNLKDEKTRRKIELNELKKTFELEIAEQKKKIAELEEQIKQSKENSINPSPQIIIPHFPRAGCNSTRKQNESSISNDMVSDGMGGMKRAPSTFLKSNRQHPLAKRVKPVGITVNRKTSSGSVLEKWLKK